MFTASDQVRPTAVQQYSTRVTEKRKRQRMRGQKGDVYGAKRHPKNAERPGLPSNTKPEKNIRYVRTIVPSGTKKMSSPFSSLLSSPATAM